MTKLTIQDVFAMFEPFGISAREVNDTLDSCKDKSQAFNVFEGLKIQVTIRFEEMRAGEVSPARFQELKPQYERLMGISLKNYTPKPKKKSSARQGTHVKVHSSKTTRKLVDIAQMVSTGDVDGLMRELDTDPTDPKERKATEDLLRKYQKRLEDLRNKK